ncbi:exonuclease SbcCD subunit D [Mycolicibacterium sp.]|jgi:DNA repair exonuclease SbcCD nuclease subunit|uniref:metallophosphoesterase family protein n=1 Tax=Mycolicibacterium sp. TaxID=2320850 RepID=UPI0028A6B54D|nr:exonuclease SbcCD subunit D [Mycolicibacterium sp.]
MKFLHTADWQLGMTRHFLDPEAQARYSAARRDAVAALGELARETGAEFVVVAGDVFDANQLAPKVVSQSLESMRAIEVPVYLLPGNHDPLDALSIYTSSLFARECPDNVTVLDRAGSWDVRPGVQLIAAPWRSKRPTTDLTAEVLADLPADGIARILLAHGAVDVLDPDPANPAQIRMAGIVDALDRSALHYVALGDKHSRTEVADRVWYSGSPEVTNYDHREADSGHVLVVDIDLDDPAHPISVESRTVGSWRFITLHRELSDSRDIADLDVNLDQLPDKDRSVVQLGLVGTLTVTDRAALDVCLDKYARLFAGLGTWERHTNLVVMPSDDEFDDLGIGGFAADAVAELKAAARSEGAAAVAARGALGLLLRLKEEGAA